MMIDNYKIFELFDLTCTFLNLCVVSQTLCGQFSIYEPMCHIYTVSQKKFPPYNSS